MEATRAGAIDATTCATIKAQIEASDDAYKVARVIRNKAVSHQDDTHTKPEIYKQARPTLPMFIKLSDQSLAIAAALCSARGLQPQDVFTCPTAQLEAMLTELQRSARMAND